MTGSVCRIGVTRTMLGCTIAMLACSLAGAPGSAQEAPPSLKEILGRAQSDSERKAVEDLIGKLQGKAAQPGQPSLETAKPPPTANVPRQPSPPSEGEQAAAAKASSEQAPATTSKETAGHPAVPDEPSSPGKADPSAASARTPPQQPAAAAEEERPPTTPKVAAKPASEAADLAVQEAERKQLPSVDLEVHFEFDSAKLTPAAVETLTTLGRALVDARLSSSEFLIGGHTDAKGRANYNLPLSERRAEAVRQFLVATFAIDGNRLAAKGFGSRYLKNPQQPRAAENRRVQVVNVTRQEAR